MPLVARDWDATANTKPLSAITAGSSYEAHWECHRCSLTSQAEVSQWTMRQTRCQRCHTERADGRNSLQPVNPALVVEWNVQASKPLRAERLKSTSDKAVVWNCRDDPAHPAYQLPMPRRVWPQRRFPGSDGRRRHARTEGTLRERRKSGPG